MNRRPVSRSCAAVLSLLLTAHAWAAPADQGPQALAAYVPARAVCFAAWAGRSNIGPGGSRWNDSTTGRLLADLQLDRWSRDVLPGLVPMGPNAAGAKDLLLDLGRTIVSHAWENESAFFSLGRGMDDNASFQPHLCFLIRFPDEASAAAAAKDLQDRVDQIAQGNPIPNTRLFNSGRVIALEFHPVEERSPLVNPAENNISLAGSPRFTAGLSQTASTDAQDTRALVLHVDLDRVWTLAIEENEENENFSRNLSLLGLTDAHAVTLSSSLTSAKEAGSWRSSSFIDMAPSAERKGLLGALSTTRPANPQILQGIPSEAVSFLSFSVDLSDWVRRLKSEGESVKVGFANQVEAWLNFSSAMLGVQVPALVKEFPVDWAFYSLPSSTTGYDHVAICRPADATAFETKLTSLAQGVRRFLLAQRKDLQPLTVDRHPGSEGEITLLTGPSLTLAWGVTNGYLLLTTDEDALRRAMTRTSQALTSETHSALPQVTARLASQSAAQISYARVPDTIQSLYASWGYTLHRAGNVKPWVFDLPFPTAEALTSASTPTVAIRWSDDAGWHWVSQAPYPGGELYSAFWSLLVGPDSLPEHFKRR